MNRIDCERWKNKLDLIKSGKSTEGEQGEAEVAEVESETLI